MRDFELYAYIRVDGRRRYVKEFDDGRQVRINRRRYRLLARRAWGHLRWE